MSSKLFLGQASNFKAKDVIQHTFATASRKWSNMLRSELTNRYQTKEDAVYLMANGRSAIIAGLKLVMPQGGEVIINGFTCYAVLQAVKKAGCKPVYADINKKTLNFDKQTLEVAIKAHPKAKAVIIQNTLGICINIQEVEALAKKHHLVIIEDLAHCAGFKYLDGREVGSVGAVTALSFGKGKSLEAITGGALIINDESLKDAAQPLKLGIKRPKLSDALRARFYPLLASIGRGLSRVHLQKYWYGPLIRMHFIERAVDAKLDLLHRPAHWQAKQVYKQLQKIQQNGALPIRTHKLVNNRAELIEKLDKSGYNFREIWYDVPVSPIRYYKKVNFPEKDCPVAVEVASSIINIPTYYPADKLAPAFDIIKEYEQ